MSDSTPRGRSNRRLVLFLAAVLVPPLLLVFGPFHDRFFPKGVAQLRELARVPPPPRDPAALRDLATGKPLAESEFAELAGNVAAARWEAVVAQLGALPRDRVTPGLMYLHGLAALNAQRPAVAIAGLEAARQSGDPRLAHEANFALAQALLMLDRGDAASRLLSELAGGTGAHAGEAAAQLAELAPIESRRPSR